MEGRKRGRCSSEGDDGAWGGEGDDEVEMLQDGLRGLEQPGTPGHRRKKDLGAQHLLKDHHMREAQKLGN